MDYHEKLRVKQERVEKEFARLNFTKVKPIWPSEQSFGFRNRAQLKTDGDSIGYLSANSNELAAIQQCPILTPANQQLLTELLNHLPNDKWRVRARPRKGPVQWTSLNFDDDCTLEQIKINQRLSFKQSHYQQNARMRTWLAQQFQSLPTNGPVLELFCGAGNFTEVIANASTQPILAVEGDAQSLQRLQEKCLLNLTTLQIDLFQEENYPRIFQKRKDYRVLVLDPPQDGLKCITHLIPNKSTIETIVYISCNLATLCRDIEQLVARGFKIQEVQPLDQNPHTPHIEILARLQR